MAVDLEEWSSWYGVIFTRAGESCALAEADKATLRTKRCRGVQYAEFKMPRDRALLGAVVSMLDAMREAGAEDMRRELRELIGVKESPDA